MERQTYFYCDPNWHVNTPKEDYPADYLIQPMPEDQAIFLNGYATCRQHLQQALDIMLERLGKVSIKRVNNSA